MHEEGAQTVGVRTLRIGLGTRLDSCLWWVFTHSSFDQSLHVKKYLYNNNEHRLQVILLFADIRWDVNWSARCQRTLPVQFSVLYLILLVSVIPRSNYNPRKSKSVTDFDTAETLLCNGHSRERTVLLVTYGHLNKTSNNSINDNLNSPDYNQHARSLLSSSPFEGYRKIPKISPSKYKPPQSGNAKNPPLNRSSKYKPSRGLVLGKLPSNTK